MNYLKYKINLSSGLIWNFQLFSVINQFFFKNITVGKSDLKCREINEILQKIYYFHIWEGGGGVQIKSYLSWKKGFTFNAHV